MADIKQEYDCKLLNIIFGQLNTVEQLHGYRVNKLTVYRDECGEFDFEINSEIINVGR